ncbi:MAG: YiiD C-terminal domain-containing protein [Gemmatimonadales bacterium]
MSPSLAALRHKLRTEMPITEHLGVRVVGHDDGCLVLSAPLSANVNHKGTAFAGSLNAAATLACWGVVWLAVRDAGRRAHVVIQDSSIRYLRPVAGDFEAVACAPAAAQLKALLAALDRRGRGRVSLTAQVRDDRGIAVEFHGRYVVLEGSEK